MILTRLADEQSIDSLPTHQPTKFAVDVQEQYGDSDRGLIEAALEQVNELIHRAASSLGLYPDHIELQRSFAKLVGQRDQLELHLARLL